MISSLLIPLKDTMHIISSGLLVPTVAILLLFAALMITELGGLLVEALTERRHIRINIAELLKVIKDRESGEILTEFAHSRLGKRQKIVLNKLIEERHLTAAACEALARQLLAGEEMHYRRITNRTDLVARLGPMLGLMATLIPLGPGLIAMGQGDTHILADSLLTAFDATVTGLAAAGIAYAISSLRKRWYEEYLGSLEALMEGLLEVFAREREIEKQTQA
ncbi:MAG: MotA/TolQ/ExbB proton channel family protein [Syntrophomonadaceae bacterium]